MCTCFSMLQFFGYSMSNFTIFNGLIVQREGSLTTKQTQ